MRRLAAEVALVLLAGCATPAALPERAGPKTTDAEILATFARDHDGFKTITADVKGNSPEGSFSGKLFLDREGRRMRLYAWKLAGALPVFDLLVEGESVRLLVPSERRMAVTTAEKFPLAAYFQTLFKPAVAGNRRVERNGRMGEVVVAEGLGAKALPVGMSGAVHGVFVLESRSLALRRQTVFGGPSNAPLVEIHYDDHMVLPDGRIWPQRMTGDKFSLEFDDILFDRPLDAKKFQMRVPPGTETVDSVEKLRRD